MLKVRTWIIHETCASDKRSSVGQNKIEDAYKGQRVINVITNTPVKGKGKHKQNGPS